MAMTVPIFYVPFLEEVFHVHALTRTDWIVATLSASTIFIGVEIYKFIRAWLRPKGMVSEPVG
jgi:hypothetical protein